MSDIPPESSWTTFEKDLRVMEWRDCVVTFRYEKEERREYEEGGWAYEIVDLAGIHVDDGNRRYRDKWSASVEMAVYDLDRICECRYRYGGEPPTRRFPVPEGFPKKFIDHQDNRVMPVAVLFLVPEQEKARNSFSMDVRLVVQYDDGIRNIAKMGDSYCSAGTVIPLVEEHESMAEIERLEREIAEIEKEINDKFTAEFTEIIRKHVATHMSGDPRAWPMIVYIDFPEGVPDICGELGRSKVEGIVVVVNDRGPKPYNIYLRTVMTDKTHGYKGLIPLSKASLVDGEWDPRHVQRLRERVHRLKSDMQKEAATAATGMITAMLRESGLTTE